MKVFIEGQAWSLSHTLRTWVRDTDKNESEGAGRRCVYSRLCDASSVR